MNFAFTTENEQLPVQKQLAQGFCTLILVKWCTDSKSPTIIGIKTLDACNAVLGVIVWSFYKWRFIKCSNCSWGKHWFIIAVDNRVLMVWLADYPEYWYWHITAVVCVILLKLLYMDTKSGDVSDESTIKCWLWDPQIEATLL